MSEPQRKYRSIFFGVEHEGVDMVINNDNNLCKIYGIHHNSDEEMPWPNLQPLVDIHYKRYYRWPDGLSYALESIWIYCDIQSGRITTTMESLYISHNYRPEFERTIDEAMRRLVNA